MSARTSIRLFFTEIINIVIGSLSPTKFRVKTNHEAIKPLNHIKILNDWDHVNQAGLDDLMDPPKNKKKVQMKGYEKKSNSTVILKRSESGEHVMSLDNRKDEHFKKHVDNTKQFRIKEHVASPTKIQSGLDNVFARKPNEANGNFYDKVKSKSIYELNEFNKNKQKNQMHQ